MNAEFEKLAILLRERVAVIADHDFRDRDPQAHLEKLKTVSEAILAEQAALADKIPFRLGHFLENCSYEKALAFIESPTSTKC
ncbi:MAG: hypothetical protein AAGJ79_08855 [Verrucomicrobiota bacterium]